MKRRKPLFIGIWNRSVILTYIGMALAVLGMVLAVSGAEVRYAFACLMGAGVADLFDGAAARRVKRTPKEKEFGIQLDSLVDVLSFAALPIVLFVAMGMNQWYHLLAEILFAVCSVARLGYFNVVTADAEKAVAYYTGLPVTYCALIFPVIYLLRYVLTEAVFLLVYTAAVVVVSVLEMLRIPIAKPKGMAYVIFVVLAAALLILFLGVL